MLGFLDIFQTGFDDGKRPQSQKVHFNQPDWFHEMSVVLRGHQAFSLGGHDGDVVGERIPANEDAAGVHAGLPNGAFQGFRKLNGFGY